MSKIDMMDDQALFADHFLGKFPTALNIFEKWFTTGNIYAVCLSRIFLYSTFTRLFYPKTLIKLAM